MGSNWSLAIDFGTSNTTAATADGDGDRIEVLEIENSRYLPSLVCASEDGELIVGRTAVAEAAVFPERAERVPKRALVAGEDSRLAGRTYRTVELVAAVLSKVAGEALRRHDGQPPYRVVLTYPARWGDRELRLLQKVALIAGIPGPEFLPEPVAAARHYLALEDLEPGRCVAVYDLGGGTFDTAVLRRTAEGFELTGAPGGDATLGGEDLDTVVRSVVATHASAIDAGVWEAIWSGEDRKAARVQAQWRQAITEAKEALSSRTSVTVWQEGYDAGIRVTRAEYETAAERLLRGSVAELAATVRRAGLAPEEIAAVYLTGGASRTPQISDLIHEMLGVLPKTTGDPKAAVALGALDRPRPFGTRTARRPSPAAARAGFGSGTPSPPGFAAPLALPAASGASLGAAPTAAAGPGARTPAASGAAAADGTSPDGMSPDRPSAEVPSAGAAVWPPAAAELAPVVKPEFDDSLFRDESKAVAPRRPVQRAPRPAASALPATRVYPPPQRPALPAPPPALPPARPAWQAAHYPDPRGWQQPQRTPPGAVPPPAQPPARPVYSAPRQAAWTAAPRGLPAPPPRERPRRRPVLRTFAVLAVLGGLAAAGAVYGPRIVQHFSSADQATGGRTGAGASAVGPSGAPGSAGYPGAADDLQAGQQVPRDLIGTWQGAESQSNFTTPHSTPVTITLTATGGTADYADGTCTDTLTATSSSGPDTVRFTQRTDDPSTCVDDVTLTLTLQPTGKLGYHSTGVDAAGQDAIGDGLLSRASG